MLLSLAEGYTDTDRAPGVAESCLLLCGVCETKRSGDRSLAEGDGSMTRIRHFPKLSSGVGARVDVS